MKRVLIILAALLMFSSAAFAGSKLTFKDVKPSNWFYQYAMKASEMGIVDGFADGTFRPGTTVTRAQLAKVMVEYDERLVKTIKENSADESKVINAISKAAPLLVYVQNDNSAGSGFFVKPDVIMTNAHVVGSVPEVMIVTSTGEKLDGTVIASDRYKDIALIKVATKYKHVELSTNLAVGQTAIAIGHPLGQKNTVTKGIVSKLNITDFKASNMFQFDAPVNAGNSGGMVINSSGQVIGMTTGKIVSDYVGTPAEGLSFAVRAHDLIAFMEANLK